MKEKKEMQIVVTADDSKAKTSLQKLADYLKNNFESGAKTAEYDIDTVKSEIKLSKLEDKIKTMKDLLKNGNLNEGEFNSWAEDIAKAEVEADKLRQTLSNTDKEVDSTSKSINNLGTKVANSLETASKKTRKFVLSLFSVRTAWAVISRASSTYLSENERTTNKVAAAWSYLGNILGPVIEKIVSWLQYGIAYVNVFVKALTGVDFLAKSIQKTAAKTNKELKKTVSSMDEIVNLDLDNGANSGVGAANALQDIADLELNPKIVEFMEKLGKAVKEVWNWAKKAWDFLEEHFGTTGAAAIVGGIALILGSAMSGGLYGMLAALTAIAAVELGAVVSKLKELSDELGKESNLEKQLLATKIALYNYYKKEYENAETEERRAECLEKMKNAYIEISDKIVTSNFNLSDSVELTGEWAQYFDNTKTIAENANDVIEDAKKNLEGIDGQTEQATIRIDADMSAAEATTGNWFSRLIKQFKWSISQVWDSIKYVFGSSSKTKAYATGGFPEEGQMFIANERGPELVGNIGGSTAVVNNQQIVESVSQGVASAVAGVLTNQKSTSQSAQYLYINGSEFAKAVYDDMETERHRRNTNTSIRRA